MAQPVEKVQPVDQPRGPAKVVPLATGSPMVPHDARSRPNSRVESWEERAGQAIAGFARSLGPAFVQARVVAGDACLYGLDQSFRIAKRVRKQAQQIKREHPLELLYGITAGAFALGLAIRVWRSKSS